MAALDMDQSRKHHPRGPNVGAADELYSIATFDANLDAIDGLRLDRMDPAASCP